VPLLALSALVAGCSSDPPDPAEVREQQVRDRLEATFSGQQASCILEALDEATIRALVRTTDLDADSDEFSRYSDAVTLCARGSSTPAATTTTAG
jgi:hypothetical protein